LGIWVQDGGVIGGREEGLQTRAVNVRHRLDEFASRDAHPFPLSFEAPFQFLGLNIYFQTEPDTHLQIHKLV
jgi:hypothetical protein